MEPSFRFQSPDAIANAAAATQFPMPSADSRTCCNSLVGRLSSCNSEPVCHARVLSAGWLHDVFTGLADVNPESRYLDCGVFGPDGWVQAPILISGQLDVSASPSADPNYAGLWWKSPAGSESGWGINFAHQGNIIFATWFTYELAGNGWWLSMAASATGPDTFAGTLYQTTGPAFDAVPFDPSLVVRTAVGTATLSFTDANNGTFAYTVNGVSQAKAITREVFGTVPNCSFGVEPDLTQASNYQDLWWASPAASNRVGASISRNKAIPSSAPGSPMTTITRRCGCWSPRPKSLKERFRDALSHDRSRVQCGAVQPLRRRRYPGRNGDLQLCRW